MQNVKENIMNNETPWYLKKSPLGNAYQHFSNPPQQEAAVKEDASIDSGSVSTEPAPPIPEHCAESARNLESAMYGASFGQVSRAQRNMAYRKLLSCLREAGFTDSQINGIIAEMEKRAKEP